MKTLTMVCGAGFCALLMSSVPVRANHDPITEHGHTCFKVSDEFAISSSNGLLTELLPVQIVVGDCQIVKSGIKKHCTPNLIAVLGSTYAFSKPNDPFPASCPSGNGCAPAPLPDVTTQPKDVVCYRIKCVDAAPVIPEQEITDMFGTRMLRKHKRAEVCLPADNSAYPTTTTTTTLP